jgi:putative membrane protein
MIAWLMVALIGALHVWILVMEMVLWETPRVRRIFGTSAEFAAATRVLAGNQGLYNGFLAAGLFWALFLGVPGAGGPVAGFFLACVLVAGIYGGLTASRRILYVQAVPAGLGLLALGLGI